jgi:hypothetical protein
MIADRIRVVQLGLAPEERILTQEMYQEFCCDHDDDIFLPR